MSDSGTPISDRDSRQVDGTDQFLVHEFVDSVPPQFAAESGSRHSSEPGRPLARTRRADGEGVAKRDLAVSRFVELTAAAPGRLVDIYGREGVVRPSADPDLVVLDPDRTYLAPSENLHSSGKVSNGDG
ncbi:hypothetical protein JOE30_001065 [Rhodococcus sp. PvP016]|uniref:Amidohydrolase 3 domain-containing protein n=1 Tax=Rhodococcoides corynebacterioides TaxID=53972 RepID=A0ABS2KYK4_9NOCA|nr:hypothetical protein [Rhodococcus corynebacterioides]MBP1115268.1 hypothetical protein [Rhodococcus sp. PvP016]